MHRLQLCDIIANHPESTSNLKVEGILRQGLASYTDMSGKLWTALANYFARLGNFEKARDVFEEVLLCLVFGPRRRIELFCRGYPR